MQDNNDFIYLTNIPKEAREHFEAIGKIMNISLKLTDDATNINNEPIKTHLRLSAAKSDYDRIELLYDKISEISRILASDYKNCLREKGYPVDSIPISKICYLGCEKLYWPS